VAAADFVSESCRSSRARQRVACQPGLVTLIARSLATESTAPISLSRLPNCSLARLSAACRRSSLVFAYLGQPLSALTRVEPERRGRQRLNGAHELVLGLELAFDLPYRRGASTRRLAAGRLRGGGGGFHDQLLRAGARGPREASNGPPDVQARTLLPGRLAVAEPEASCEEGVGPVARNPPADASPETVAASPRQPPRRRRCALVSPPAALPHHSKR
jgi:hypothetical protein